MAVVLGSSAAHQLLPAPVARPGTAQCGVGVAESRQRDIANTAIQYTHTHWLGQTEIVMIIFIKKCENKETSHNRRKSRLLKKKERKKVKRMKNGQITYPWRHFVLLYSFFQSFPPPIYATRSSFQGVVFKRKPTRTYTKLTFTFHRQPQHLSKQYQAISYFSRFLSLVRSFINGKMLQKRYEGGSKMNWHHATTNATTTSPPPPPTNWITVKV